MDYSRQERVRTCLNCWRAGESVTVPNFPAHCDTCPCCKPCATHGMLNCLPCDKLTWPELDRQLFEDASKLPPRKRQR